MDCLKRSCDVLLINPPSPDGHIYIRDVNRSGRRSRERTLWPQTSLAYLGAVAKDAGYEVNIFDCIADEMTWDQVREYIRDHRPKWIIIEGISSVITNDVYASFLGKRYGVRTILLGPHVTALPVETMEAYPSLDYGILGEAEETLAELLRAVDDGQEDLSGIQGLVYRDGRSVHTTGERPFIEDLDSLPMPLHELLPLRKYYAPYLGGPYTFVLHSRGCPNACHFCRQNVMWKSYCRLRSGESIATELKHLASLGVRKVMFHSDTFTQDRDNVIDICKHLIEANTGIQWICNGRVDRADPEMLQWMKKAGCWMVNYGIESGVAEILQKSNKGEQATPERARQTVLDTKAAGIKVWGYFIIGLPGETWDTIDQTSRFARSLPLDMVNFAVASPYPGTEFHKMAEENGWLKKVEWEDFDQNYSVVVSYPELSDTDILAGIRRCYIQWFRRPRGIRIFLKGMTSWRNIRTLLKLAFSHARI